MIENIKLTSRTASGTLVRVAALIERKDGRIFFVKSPFALKDEIKAMRGSRWHGYDEEEPRKMWSIDDCQRNNFQLAFLCGEDVYAWFDRPLIRHEYRPLYRDGMLQTYMPHQVDLSDAGLTYHYQIFGAEMGVGKSLSAQMVMEKSGVDRWWWVGPKTSIPNIKREFRLWQLPTNIQVEFFTFEGLVRVMDEWTDAIPPMGFIEDESSRTKNSTSQRSRACQRLADLIRQHHGFKGYVIEMSGTPSPKTPVDWYSQCEIAWPGFLKEGSARAMEERMAFMALQAYDSGSFKKRLGWKDDAKKCDVCGVLEELGPHQLDECEDPEDYHAYKPSKNEVAYLNERLKGLVIIKHKKDCLSLPDKRYRKIICKPTASALRVAEAVVQSAPNAITGMTLLRELSDGFQYREEQDGMVACRQCADGTIAEWSDPDAPERTYQAIDLLDPDVIARLQKQAITCPTCGGTKEVPKMVRVAREVPCPKDAALKMLLDENEEVGRLVVFAGFTGSIDRIVRLCHKEKWAVVRCDQGNFQVLPVDGVCDEEPLDYWADMDHARVAFVANPESGGMSLTLVEARMAVYWSNSYKAEFRAQSEDRVHRIGMDLNKGCTIVDLIHLPSDERVLSLIRENRRLELMTMGEIVSGIKWEGSSENGEMVVMETA